MKLQGTCGHCDHGKIGVIVCPACWGTTVNPQVLTAAKQELERLRHAYASKKSANKSLRGAARGWAGHALSHIGTEGRKLRKEVDQIEQQIVLNKAVSKVVGAAVGA
jgi:hypothetical protein